MPMTNCFPCLAEFKHNRPAIPWQKNLHMFYSSLPECENGVWWLAASGEVLHANDAAARLTRGCYDHPAFGQLANMHLSGGSERVAWMLPQAGGGE